ncbi:ATP-dependent Clp protease ATP-binding subunit ClpX, partial [Acinetobacter baumannii]|nr:ATP-dependent Clp protease ATP-binding subunit ClpX [Acinetobacter baumannii]
MKRSKPACSFCGRQHPEVAHLIESPLGEVYICNDCVGRAVQILEDESPKQHFRGPQRLPKPAEIKSFLD